MGMNAIEKILANHSEVDVVRPGDVVMVDVDVTVQFDHARPDILEIANPDKVVLVHDHVVPAPTVQAANNAKRMREFVERFGIEHYFPVGKHGISHVLVAAEGYALPGQILVNADSHTCSSGAMNCLARGMGGPEMLYIMCKGQTWYLVGPTTRVVLEGSLPEQVYPRDVIHHLPGTYGDFAGRNLEWYGDGLSTIGIDGRLTMATISAELSAEFSLFPYDDVLAEYLDGRAKWPYEPAFPDDDAEYEQVITVDLSSLEPQVVLPDRVAWNTKGAREVAEDRIKIDQAFIGSCANGRLSDFAVAAEILEGRTIARGTRMIVTPGSQEILKEAIRLGYVETLMDAGAVVTSSTCGACFGGHMGLLADGEVCITASTRNFKGRMGSPEARVYMGSPATVAASAVTGYITDPRDL
ncbi:MAG TPA: aconitase/3-isopropylmalate dehydratase large subunit family protein [Acidimicrobiales bacterium]|nr:aconitase/3-isopropylmalate dehydratase large subunit family protein [Acidimicrobiales bacterium]